MKTVVSRLRGAWLPLLILLLMFNHPCLAGTQEQSATAAEPAIEPVAIPAATDRFWTGWTLMAGSYAVMGAYTYYSWYQAEDPVAFSVTNDGWFGKDTYAGGADKLGHFFANYVITRTGYEVLTWSGLSRDKALASSLALDALFFTAIEIKDGLTENLGFSWGDIAANLCGNLLAAAFVFNPALDRSLDFRLEYSPSREYLDAIEESGTVNAVEDYTGMTYGLWYHLGEVPGLKKVPALSWLRFVDIGVTYGTRYYRPHPSDDRPPRQELAAGLTLNVAAIVRALADAHAPRVAGASDWIFEYFTVPGTVLEVL